MNLDDFVRSCENAIDEVPPGSLGPQTRFRDLAQWSSLAALNLIAMADADYGLELAADDLKRSQTIEDLFKILCAKPKQP
jgi:acyl carrier protein